MSITALKTAIAALLLASAGTFAQSVTRPYQGGTGIQNNNAYTLTLSGANSVSTFTIEKLGLNSAPDNRTPLFISGNFTGSSAVLGAFINPSLTPTSNGNMYGAYISPTLNLVAGQAHNLAIGLRANTVITPASGATVAVAANLYVDSAPTAGIANYSIYTDGAVATGALTITGTGSFSQKITLGTNNDIGFAIQPSGTTNGAFGQFTNGGGTLSIGLDSSTGAAFGTAGNYGTVIYRPASTGFAISRAGTADLTISSTGTIALPNQPSTTGVRYLCINTTGVIVSQAAACVGT